MINRVSAPGLEARPYFKRYTDDAVDLCDCLSSFDSRGKLKLHELLRALNLPGKPDDLDGSKVAEFVEAGRIAEVAAYCETDVVSTYRVWLVHELFAGRLTRDAFEASEANLMAYIGARLEAKPHLSFLVTVPTPSGLGASPIQADITSGC